MPDTKKKLLLADPDTEFTQALLHHEKAAKYTFEVVHDGTEALEKLSKETFDLVIIDQMMPHIHAVEIIKQIQQKGPNKETGWIVTSYHIMIQNWHAAVDLGANAFLPKPLDLEKLFSVVHSYFDGSLKPPELPPTRTIFESEVCYTPQFTPKHNYLRFWGTRGSNAVSGAEYVRFGGNTSCLEVRHGKELIVIDAGTGIRELSDAIKDQHFGKIHLFLSHTHWDHLTGFPFFDPVYDNTSQIIIYSPIGFEQNSEEIFTNMLAYAFFPVRLDDMQSKIVFKSLQDHDSVEIGEISISTHYTNHPGVTLGFKIESPNKKIAYITDNELLLGFTGHPNTIHRKHPLLKPHLSLLEFVKGVDVLVHEAQYFQEEYMHKVGWGHSSMANATIFAKYADCKHWVATHHDPNHTDKILQKKMQTHLDILNEMNMRIPFDMAYDGFLLPI